MNVTDKMVEAARAAYSTATGCNDTPHVLDGWIDEALRAALTAALSIDRGEDSTDDQEVAPTRAYVKILHEEIEMLRSQTATISSLEARIEELEGFEVIGVQHRIRIKEPTASWSEWREGSLNLTEKALEYLDSEERQVYARRTLSKGTGE